MNLERKKIIEKIGYAVIVSFIIFLFFWHQLKLKELHTLFLYLGLF